LKSAKITDITDGDLEVAMVAVATKFAVAKGDQGEIRKAVELLGHSGPGERAGLFVSRPDGKKIAVELPPKVVEAMRGLLAKLIETNEVLLVNEEAELSPEDAGKILGVSRPLIYKRMDDGHLPFREVGAHRRVLLRDVLALKPSEDRRRCISKELGEDTDDLEVNYARPSQGPA
jgi:excisionase family DNA binding protein